MRRHFVLFALGAAAIGLARDAAAQGFQVNEHGSCVMARGGTGTAKPCADGSAMVFNPAGLVDGRSGWTITAGVTFIDAYGGFTDDFTESYAELQNSPVPVPHGFIHYRKDKLAAGIGVFLPYGLGTSWEDTFQGAFAGYDNDLRNFYIQPTVAYRVHPMISVGAGFDLIIGSVTLTQLVDLSEQPVPGLGTTTFGMLGVPSGTAFANGQLTGSGTGFGGHFGLQITPHERVRLGVNYLMRVTMDYEGDVDFSPYPTGIRLPADNPFGAPAGTPLDSVVSSAFVAGPLLDQPVAASAPMPDQLSAGIAVDVMPTLTLLADYNWVHWSLFKELAVTFPDNDALSSTTIENYENTHGVRVGFDWDATSKLAVRGGYIWHQAAAPDQTVTPLLPEGPRAEFSLGFGYKIGQRFSVDAAYQYLNQQIRRGRTGEFPSGVAPDLSLNNGLYKFKAHLIGITLTAGF